MNIKNVVKAMNFRSLLRVDKARKDAEKYFEVEKELRLMIASITNNRNYILDKKILKADPSKPILNIYIGSDFGFCGGYNLYVNDSARKDDDSDKILIGKKLWKNIKNIKIAINKDDYLKDRSLITDYINKAVINRDYSEINVLFNSYFNISNIQFIKRKLYPLDLEQYKDQKFNEDFVCESNIDELLVKMMATYIDYEVLIIMKNSLASENILRQNYTSESLKKIDEIEAEKAQEEYKEKIAEISAKTIENYVKLKASEDRT